MCSSGQSSGFEEGFKKATFPIGPIVVLFFVVYDLESYREIPKGTTKEPVGSFRVLSLREGMGLAVAGLRVTAEDLEWGSLPGLPQLLQIIRVEN